MNILRFLFLVLTAPIVILYPFFLIDKIRRPEYKNLGYEEYASIGLIVILLAAADYYILKEIFQLAAEKQQRLTMYMAKL